MESSESKWPHLVVVLCCSDAAGAVPHQEQGLAREPMAHSMILLATENTGTLNPPKYFLFLESG